MKNLLSIIDTQILYNATNGGLSISDKEKKAFKFMLIDSLIIGLIILFTTLPTSNIPDMEAFYIAGRAALAAFVVQLSFERGIKKRLP